GVRGRHVAGRRVGTRGRRPGGDGEVPGARRSLPDPPDLVEVPVDAAVRDLVRVEPREVVADRVTGRVRRADVAGQVVVADRAVRPVQAVDVGVVGAVGDHAHTAGRVEVRRRVAGGRG